MCSFNYLGAIIWIIVEFELAVELLNGGSPLAFSNNCVCGVGCPTKKAVNVLKTLGNFWIQEHLLSRSPWVTDVYWPCNKKQARRRQLATSIKFFLFQVWKFYWWFSNYFGQPCILKCKYDVYFFFSFPHGFSFKIVYWCDQLGKSESLQII